jgi:hypothetical protein
VPKFKDKCLCELLRRRTQGLGIVWVTGCYHPSGDNSPVHWSMGEYGLKEDDVCTE